jgi:hypothetical protein
MWAVKVKDENAYVGVCTIPQPGFTVSAFPGNDIYQPRKYPTKETAQKVVDALLASKDATFYGKWEVVPYPGEEKA